MHGMGYSEPQAGSDLAALRTSAVRDGDRWVINGQKIWTTTWWGKYMFLAARTDRNARPPHAGISLFIVPMNTPGITIQPAAPMYDGSFAQHLLRRRSHPPRQHRRRGQWRLEGADRRARFRARPGRRRHGAGGRARVRAVARPLLAGDDDRSAPGQDPVIRDRMAALACEIEVGRQLIMHCAEFAADGERRRRNMARSARSFPAS